MSITFGFYNSKEGDRRYDAVQMSSIFDGIIEDGVLQHVGERLNVTATGENMLIDVDTGRAWFNHTWTLNDSILPLEVPQAEMILNRIDAVVLDVDAREETRANAIKIVPGAPASEPQNPTLEKTQDHWQYPLAYVRVRAGATVIRQEDITNCVGTSECPYVTAPLEKMSVDGLIAQWKDEWKSFFEAQKQDIQNTNEAWRQQWQAFYDERAAEIDKAADELQKRWEERFTEYANSCEAEFDAWRAEKKEQFSTWFTEVQALLDGDVAANIAGQIALLTVKITMLESHAILDSGYEGV